MIRIVSKIKPQPQPAVDWHEPFLAMLPKIVQCVRRAFVGYPPAWRHELVDEAVANALVAYVRLVELGKVDLAYPNVLARYAVAQVRSGRRVGTPLNTNDVFSAAAQQRGCFRVERLDQAGGNCLDHAWRDAVTEDRRTPVPDQAAFRIDFPAWLGRHSKRQQRIALALAKGERTKDVAKRYKLSDSRISELRREFAGSWAAYHGEDSSDQERFDGICRGQ